MDNDLARSFIDYPIDYSKTEFGHIQAAALSPLEIHEAIGGKEDRRVRDSVQTHKMGDPTTPNETLTKWHGVRTKERIEFCLLVPLLIGLLKFYEVWTVHTIWLILPRESRPKSGQEFNIRHIDLKSSALALTHPLFVVLCTHIESSFLIPLVRQIEYVAEMT